MNKMTDTLAARYGRKAPKQTNTSPLTYTAWLYVVQIGKDSATFVRSKEDRGAYELAKLKQGKFPRYYSFPLAPLRLKQDGPSGAVLMQMPLALALDKRLVRHSFSNRE